MIFCIQQYEDVQIAGVGLILLLAELPRGRLAVLYDWLAHRNNSALSTYGNEGGNIPSLSFSCICINTCKHTASNTYQVYFCAPNNLLSFGKCSKNSMYYILNYSLYKETKDIQCYIWESIDYFTLLFFWFRKLEINTMV